MYKAMQNLKRKNLAHIWVLSLFALTATSALFVIPSTTYASAPVITNLIISATSTSAVMTWNTDVAASSTVSYGTTANYALATSSSSFVTSHYLKLYNLVPMMTYHYQVSSADALGNVTATTDATFTTPGSLTENPWGLLGPDASTLPYSTRLGIIQALQGHWLRIITTVPATGVVHNTTVTEISPFENAGYQIFLTISNLNATSGTLYSAGNIPTYESQLQTVLQNYPVAIVSAENEVDNYPTNMTAADYLNELQATCTVAHQMNMLCTDSGMTSKMIIALLVNNYIQEGDNADAIKYAPFLNLWYGSTFNASSTVSSISSYLASSTSIVRAEAMLAGTKAAGADMINFHWYEEYDGITVTPPILLANQEDILSKIITFLNATTTLPVNMGEGGQQSQHVTDANLPAVDVTAMMNIYQQADVNPVIWWGPGASTTVGNLTPAAHNLFNANGTIYNTGQAFSQFITNEFAVTPPDVTPPVISSIVVSSTTDTGAIIAWNTDEPSTTNIAYNTTLNFGLSSTSPSLVTSHSLILSNLTPGTPYFFQVESSDGSGNTATSTTATFTTTGTAPVVVVSSGGGGGGSSVTTTVSTGGGGGGATTITSASSTNTTTAITTPSTTTTTTSNTNPLGTAAYVFTRNLAVGSTGDDVLALQNLLIALKYLQTTASGYFGALTKAAVIEFQTASGISPVGSVGPVTRAMLNGSSTGTTSSAITSTVPTSSSTKITLNLSEGSSNSDVTTLQNLLTLDGDYTGPITGYFGALTQAGVIAYQNKHGLPAVGSVGPLTRASLNQ